MSIHTIYRMLRKGKNMTVPECFIQDFMLCEHFSCERNFLEGVRTVLIDRDDKPKWEPIALEEVTEAQLDKLFTFVSGKSNFVI